MPSLQHAQQSTCRFARGTDCLLFLALCFPGTHEKGSSQTLGGGWVGDTM